MKIRVHSILQLKEVLGGKDVEIIVPEGTNISGLLAGMVEIWGIVFPLISSSRQQEIHPYVRLMVNGKTIQSLNGMETILKDGDKVLLIPLAAGG